MTTGRGATSYREDDPASFSIKNIELGGEFARYSPIKRVLQEFRYAALALRAIRSTNPDVAVFANVPILPLALVALGLRLRHIPFVFWWQDVYSEAVGSIAKKKSGLAGIVAAQLFAMLERAVARQAAAIVPITDVFLDCLNDWKIDSDKVTVIHNWGTSDEITPRSRRNAWATSHGLSNVKVIMYAGTLGLKHDPSLIAELARSIGNDCRMVVVTQGRGREWLEEHCSDNPNLILLDFQPYDDLADMLGSADVLLAVLEEDASRYSVPSKVLNYLCAGRPVLALLPADNAVAQTVEAAKAGIVISPDRRGEMTEAVNRLLSDPILRGTLGSNARRYAEEVFDLGVIADKFECVIVRAVGRTTGTIPAEQHASAAPPPDSQH